MASNSQLNVGSGLESIVARIYEEAARDRREFEIRKQQLAHERERAKRHAEERLSRFYLDWLQDWQRVHPKG